MGPKHKQFQADLEKYLGVENVELLTNGHMALELTLQAMNLQGEVITTPFTFASTIHAIVRNGLKPVFCDIDPLTFTMDTEKLENVQSQGNRFLEVSMTRGTKIFLCPLLWVHYKDSIWNLITGSHY